MPEVYRNPGSGQCQPAQHQQRVHQPLQHHHRHGQSALKTSAMATSSGLERSSPRGTQDSMTRTTNRGGRPSREPPSSTACATSHPCAAVINPAASAPLCAITPVRAAEKLGIQAMQQRLQR